MFPGEPGNGRGEKKEWKYFMMYTGISGSFRTART